MPNRRLALRRETLTALDTDQLALVAGAVSGLHPNCLVTSEGSQCPSCGSYCVTRYCPPASVDIC